MVYLVKDLLINVLPPDKQESDAERLPWWVAGYAARWPTLFHLILLVPPVPTLLGPRGPLPTGDSASAALLLANLKAQVKSALHDLEREKDVAAHVAHVESGRGEARDYLEKALEEIGHEERTIDAKLRPHTLSQIKELQAKLDEAQRELKRLKSELEKK